MAVPTLMSDLSVTAASNSPADSESPSTTENFLQAIQSIVARQHPIHNEVRLRYARRGADPLLGLIPEGFRHLAPPSSAGSGTEAVRPRSVRSGLCRGRPACRTAS